MKMSILEAFLVVLLQATYFSNTILIYEQRTLNVVWNVPTRDCMAAGVPTLHPERYGIWTNDEQATIGNTVALFFMLGKFPVILTNDTWIFGGIPQNGNLTEHLEAVKSDIDIYIPNEDFEGLGVIDFEAWRPVWSMAVGTQGIYRDASVELVRRQHPEWNDSSITNEAASKFEQAGSLAVQAMAAQNRRSIQGDLKYKEPNWQKYRVNYSIIYNRSEEYMLETLHICQSLRPRGKWGYYGYPLVDNYEEGHYNVSRNYMMANDQLIELYTNSTALFPSIYVFQSNLTPDERTLQVRERLIETFRVIQDDLNSTLPVYPYFWFAYHDVDDEYLTQVDLTDIIGAVYESGVDGMVIWGHFDQVNTEQKCQQLGDYLDAELGPAVTNLTTNSTL